MVDPNEHVRRVGADLFYAVSGAFESLSTRFQHEKLRWIERMCFSRRDAEERSIKGVNIIDEAAPTTERFGTSIEFGAPAMFGHVRDGVTTDLE